MKKTPRPYQTERIDGTIQRLRQLARGEAVNHPAIVIPTGTGKTFTALCIVDRALNEPWAHAGRALWLTDSKPLVTQTERAAAAEGIPVEVRTIQGIHARSKGIRPGEYDLIVVDEAHKFLTEKRLETLRQAETPLLGLTATPRQGDGRHIKLLFGEDYICGPYTLGAAVLDGYLCDCEVHRIELHDLDLAQVKKGKRDFNSQPLAQEMNVDSHNEEIVNRWRDIAVAGRDTVPLSNFFCVDTAHADEMAETINRIMGREIAHPIHSNLTDKDPGKLLDEFLAGGIRVVTSVSMVAEGFDHPALEVGVLARPTRSERLLVQMLGRFLRNHPDKKHAVILDCDGAYERLDLARIYDVVEPESGDQERSLSEPSDSPWDLDEGIPMLSEIISRVRKVDLFRRASADARTLPWARVGERFAIAINGGDKQIGGHVVVGRERGAETVAAAWLYYGARQRFQHGALAYGGHPPRIRVLCRGKTEPEAFREAEHWIKRTFPEASWSDQRSVSKADRWFRDRGKTSAGQIRKIAEIRGIRDAEPPAERWRAQSLIKAAFASGRVG